MDQPTPLLRWGKALLKLELSGPRGSVAARAGFSGARVAATGNQALALARPGLEVALRGAVTHEMRETLKLWGARLVDAGEPFAPGPAVFARTLGAELLAELTEAPPLLVCPAGEPDALLGALSALRERWPSVHGVALVAAGEELPDLPRDAALPAEIERVAVTRAQAAEARSRVARELGLLANHAGAAAAVYAREHGGVAIVTALGEREFSLDRAP
jgi:hypothetical protein